VAGLPSLGGMRVVYVVEPHPIAASYLAITLKRNPGLKVVACDLSLRGDPSFSGKPSILIVDAGALPFPFAPFLRTARAEFRNAPVPAIAGHASDVGLVFTIGTAQWNSRGPRARRGHQRRFPYGKPLEVLPPGT
jgi:hypothetical protein